MNSIRVFQNSETLANELAICWHEQAKEAAKNHNWFSVVLSGGNTAPLIYGKLAEPKWKNCIPWSFVHIFSQMNVAFLHIIKKAIIKIFMTPC